MDNDKLVYNNTKYIASIFVWNLEQLFLFLTTLYFDYNYFSKLWRFNTN